MSLVNAVIKPSLIRPYGDDFDQEHRFGSARPDGIYFDPFNERVYVFSHPTKDATVIDAKDGTVLSTIDLGGTPEQSVGDGKGMLYVVMQDAVSVTAVEEKTMKAVAHYSFVDKGGCNGLALDAKTRSCLRHAALFPSYALLSLSNTTTSMRSMVSLLFVWSFYRGGPCFCNSPKSQLSAHHEMPYFFATSEGSVDTYHV